MAERWYMEVFQSISSAIWEKMKIESNDVFWIGFHGEQIICTICLSDF